jgi:hypothetical protein
VLYQGATAIYEGDAKAVLGIGSGMVRHAFTAQWGQYPVYANNQSTVRAIEVLKVLEAAKVLKMDTYAQRFELVEKIRHWVG